MTSPQPDWAGALLAGDRLALARAITAVENETRDAAAILALIAGRLGRARVVGFTGAPGAGKSTLVGAFCAELRARGLTVGIVAVDPSSPLTGGAILGMTASSSVRWPRAAISAGFRAPHSASSTCWMPPARMSCWSKRSAPASPRSRSPTSPIAASSSPRPDSATRSRRSRPA
ncbi:MAG: hypothetical protein ACT7A5_20465, partial [Ferrovibrionaceae bacterium]